MQNLYFRLKRKKNYEIKLRTYLNKQTAFYLTGTNWIKCLMRRSNASTKLLSVDAWSWVVAINCLQNVSVNTCTRVFFKMPTSSAVTFQPASIDDVIGAENKVNLSFGIDFALSATFSNESMHFSILTVVCSVQWFIEL